MLWLDKMSLSLRCTLALASAVGVAAHGMIIHPKSRNANDAAHIGAGPCNAYVDYNPPYTNVSVGFRETGSGQPCLWFSQGIAALFRLYLSLSLCLPSLLTSLRVIAKGVPSAASTATTTPSTRTDRVCAR